MKKTHLIPKLLASLALLGNLSSTQVTNAVSINKTGMNWTAPNGQGTKTNQWRIRPGTNEEIAAKIKQWNKALKNISADGKTILWDKANTEAEASDVNSNKAPAVCIKADDPGKWEITEDNVVTMVGLIAQAERAKVKNGNVADKVSKKADAMIKALHELAEEMDEYSFEKVELGAEVTPTLSPNYAILAESGTALELRDGVLDVVTGTWTNAGAPAGSTPNADLTKIYEENTEEKDAFVTPEWTALDNGIALSFKPDSCKDHNINEHEILPKGVEVDAKGLLRLSDGSYAAIDDAGGDPNHKIVSNGALRTKKVNAESEATKLGRTLLDLMGKTPAIKGGQPDGPQVLDSKVFEVNRIRELNLKLLPTTDNKFVLVNKYGEKVDWSGKSSTSDVEPPSSGCVLDIKTDPTDYYPVYLQSLIAKDDDKELLEILRKGSDVPRSCFIRLKKVSVKEGDKTETRYVVTNWSGDKWVGDPAVSDIPGGKKVNWVSDEKSAMKFKENESFPILFDQPDAKLTSTLIKQLSKGGLWFNNITASPYNKAIKIGGGVGVGGLVAGGGFLGYMAWSNSHKPASGTGGRHSQRAQQNQNKAKEKNAGKSW